MTETPFRVRIAKVLADNPHYPWVKHFPYTGATENGKPIIANFMAIAWEAEPKPTILYKRR